MRACREFEIAEVDTKKATLAGTGILAFATFAGIFLLLGGGGGLDPNERVGGINGGNGTPAGLIQDLRQEVPQEERALDQEKRALEAKLAALRKEISDLEPRLSPPSVPQDPELEKWKRYTEFELAGSKIQRVHARRWELDRLRVKLGLSPDQQRSIAGVLERRDDRLLELSAQPIYSELEESRTHAVSRAEVREFLDPAQREIYGPESSYARGDGYYRDSWDEVRLPELVRALGLAAEQGQTLKDPLWDFEQGLFRDRIDLERIMRLGQIDWQDYQEGLRKVLDARLESLRDLLSSRQLETLRALKS